VLVSNVEQVIISTVSEFSVGRRSFRYPGQQLKLVTKANLPSFARAMLVGERTPSMVFTMAPRFVSITLMVSPGRAKVPKFAT
jgi:hypothetical protein